MDHSSIRVYARQLQSPNVIHQVCVSDWGTQKRRSHEGAEPREPPHVDVVFGKGSFLALYRFFEEDAGPDSRPTGSLNLVHEQPVFGTIKDMKALHCSFSKEEYSDVGEETESPRYGYLPKGASSMVLLVTSDSGSLSFVTFAYDKYVEGRADQGRFHVLKHIELGRPGFDYTQAGAKIAVDPTNRVVAVSAFQNCIKLVVIRKTTRSNFEPVEGVSDIDLNGTIIGMEFLTTGEDDEDNIVILAVLFYNKETSKYHITTFHIGLQPPPVLLNVKHPITIQYGASQLVTNPLRSVVLLKALPDIPRAMVYVDEEKITVVTVDRPKYRGVEHRAKHTHHPSLQLLKREPLQDADNGLTASSSSDFFPLISACATPPPSPYVMNNQTIYLGSDTSELYRISIQQSTYAMQYELISGERPVGRAMQVLARREFAPQAEEEEFLSSFDVLGTDYLMYSGDYGDGGVLAIKEEEHGIEVFAVTELQNHSPVLDFCVNEPVFPGRDALYVCSGMRTEGCLKRIRSGISVESSESSGNELFAGATGIWSAKENLEDPFDTFLVVSFIQSTRVMRAGEDGGLEDVSDSCNLDLERATVHAGRIKNGMIFQVHRSGVIVSELATGARHVWDSGDGVITSACLIEDGILALGLISTGASSLLVLKLAQVVATGANQAASYSIHVVASKSLQAEPTTIHCWTQTPSDAGPSEATAHHADVFCCVGTLEPTVIVFRIAPSEIHELYKHPLTLAGLESVATPHSICVLASHHKGRLKIVLGLRDGSILTYDWTKPEEQQQGQSILTSSTKAMSSPRLYKLGVLPVKFTFRENTALASALVVSDKLWQARFDQEFEIQPILFNSEVSHACPFHTTEEEQLSEADFAFIVGHDDMQLVTLEGAGKYQHQTLALGRTPRRMLDLASNGLLLVASVSEGFPFAESILQLVDPDRISHIPGLEKQHVVADYLLRRGESVYCMAEWKVPRANKSDAVYICIGTGILSPTGSEVSAAAPKTGRLVVLSVKQPKRSDHKVRKFELELKWAMSMPAPVFAMCAFMDMKLLISNGPVLKLLALDMEKKSLVEKASHRERWPIVQISSSGSMICTGSRRESICFYEYQAGIGGERSLDKLRFLKSAQFSRYVSDCMALSPEFAIGADADGGIFGVGYSADDPSCQYTLLDRFSYNVGEVATRIRLTKIWSARDRTLLGVALPEQNPDTVTIAGGGSSIAAGRWKESGQWMDVDEDFTSNNSVIESRPLQPSSADILSWTLLPWTTLEPASSKASVQSNDTASTSTSPALTPPSQSSSSVSPSSSCSSQALIACTIVGGIFGFWRLQPQLYPIIDRIQSAMQTSSLPECRPLLNNSHSQYRSGSGRGAATASSLSSASGPFSHTSSSAYSSPSNTVDGDYLAQFLRLGHKMHVKILYGEIGLDRAIEDWVQWTKMSPQTQAFLRSTPVSAQATRDVEAAAGVALQTLVGQAGTGAHHDSATPGVPTAAPGESMAAPAAALASAGEGAGCCFAHLDLERELFQKLEKRYAWEAWQKNNEQARRPEDVERDKIEIQRRIQETCATAKLVCHILSYLQTLDWHQQ